MLHRLLLLATLATHTSAQFTTHHVLDEALKSCVGFCQQYTNLLTFVTYNVGGSIPAEISSLEEWMIDPATVCFGGDWITGTGTDISLPISTWIGWAGGVTVGGDWVTADAPVGETDFCALMPYWDVSAMTDFSHIFANAFTFNVDISHWDVSAGTNFQGMFYSAASFAQNLNTWQISRTANTDLMFAISNDGGLTNTETLILPALCSEAWLDNKEYMRTESSNIISTFAPYGALCACNVGMELLNGVCAPCAASEYSLGGAIPCAQADDFTLGQLKSTDKGLQELKRAYQTANGCSS